MAKAEHAAICPIDNRLDHLGHSPGTHFSLSQVFKKKKKRKTKEGKKKKIEKKTINNNKENQLSIFTGKRS